MIIARLKGTVPAVANGGFGDTRPGPCLSWERRCRL